MGGELTPPVSLTLSAVYLPGAIPVAAPLALDWTDLRTKTTMAIDGFMPIQVTYDEGEDGSSGMVVVGSLAARGGRGNLRLEQTRMAGNLVGELLSDGRVRLEYTCEMKMRVLIVRVHDDTPRCRDDERFSPGTGDPERMPAAALAAARGIVRSAGDRRLSGGFERVA